MLLTEIFGIATLFIFLQSGRATADVCAGLSGLAEASTPESRFRASEDTLRNIAPRIYQSIRDAISRDSTSDQLRVAYSVLASNFGRNFSDFRLLAFESALVEISIAKAEACAHLSDLPSTSTLIQQFRTGLENSDYPLLRSALGQLLCIDGEHHRSRRRRQTDCPPRDSCTCPPGGLSSSSLFCVCEFFACLDPNNDLTNILGFNTQQECLVFAVDTTGSMGSEIDAAKQIILDFVRSEEDIGELSCYALVPFNDVGSADASVGPITVAYTENLRDLQFFYSNVTTLTAHGGGDLAEYALRAMLDGLRATSAFLFGTPLEIMTPGSQMVVMTDAPSKQPKLRDTVISGANDREVCVHFFLSDNPTADGIYRGIADETSGTFLNGYSNWQLANFIAAYYLDSPCRHTLNNGRKKRVAITFPSSASCQSFNVSSFTRLLKLSIGADEGSSVTIIRPSVGGTPGRRSVVRAGAGDFAVFSEGNPVPGTWQTCISRPTPPPPPLSGILFRKVSGGPSGPPGPPPPPSPPPTTPPTVSPAQSLAMDTTVVYINERREATSVAPPACSLGSVAVVSSQADFINEAMLNLVDRFGDIILAIPLTRCTGALVSGQVQFPLGNFTYYLVGRDSSGIAFNHNMKIRVKFSNSPTAYILQGTGPLTVEFERGSIGRLTFNLKNLHNFASNFTLSASYSTVFATRVIPATVSLSAGRSVEVRMDVRAASSSAMAGARTRFTLTASNGCMNVTATRNVMLRENEPPSEESSGCSRRCQNGGTCTAILHRGRRIERCQCPTGYGGQNCQIAF